MIFVKVCMSINSRHVKQIVCVNDNLWISVITRGKRQGWGGFNKAAAQLFWR